MELFMPTENSAKTETTFVKGLDGVVASQTVLSLVDGANSKLYYRGVPVEELASQSTFEETVYFLWEGKFPTSSELTAFKKLLAEHRAVPAEVLNVLKSFPKTAHPMGVLRSMISVLGIFDKDGDKQDPQTMKTQALRLTASLPTVMAAFFRIRQGKEIIQPDAGLSQAADFLYMMHGKTPAPEMERALDAYLILLADHGLNASTFAARVTTATESDMYSAVTSAVGTLKGDLHGSANQRAMEMILEIGSADKAEDYVRDLLKQKKKVMGFGHRIYKKEDPRAAVFRGIARKLCERVNEFRWTEISGKVEKVMMEEKQIPCNVDFFSASVLYVLGFPVDFFTTVFASSRVAGWTAHVIEQRKDNRLIRPAAEYIGPADQHYIPMDKRK